jgi:hypothetical protein
VCSWRIRRRPLARRVLVRGIDAGVLGRSRDARFRTLLALLGRLGPFVNRLPCSALREHASQVTARGDRKTMTSRSNKAVNTDAQVRPLPSVAPSLVRRLPLRYAA